jgi:hypothetical protein
MGFGPTPGEQFLEAVDRVPSDEAGEDVGEIGLRIDGARFASLDQRSEDGPV